MSSNCSFEFHITNLNKRTKHLTGWVLITFFSRDQLTMLTLFKALVLSQADYGFQLWSPHIKKGGSLWPLFIYINRQNHHGSGSSYMDNLINRSLYMSCHANLDSNPGPSALKASAVPNELTWQTLTWLRKLNGISQDISLVYDACHIQRELLLWSCILSSLKERYIYILYFMYEQFWSAKFQNFSSYTY